MVKGNHCNDIKYMKNIIICLAVFLHFGIVTAQNSLTLCH